MKATMDQINLEEYRDLQFEIPKNNSNAIPVYGPFERLYLNDWGQSYIHHNIVKAFIKMNITQMTPIQKNAFLYLMKNYNTSMVGYSKGKSISYLTSIFSLIMNKTYAEMTKGVIGPIAIVLTNSQGSCCILENLSKQLNFFDKTNNNIRVVVADASTPSHIVEAKLCNGCNILIATPTYLSNLIKKSKLFSLLNLRYFVFDNIDLLLENYKDMVFSFYEILKKMKDKTDNIQFISTSVRWTKEMDEFLKVLFVKWQYIFGSPLEAAHYMNIEFNVVHIKNDKLERISQCLKSNIKYGRSVLITSNTDELHTISNYFQSDDSDIEVLLAIQLRSAISLTIENWKQPLKKNQRLLICSDDMMLDYYISDADCIIHYDIPAEKHKFAIRFSVLQDSNLIFTEKKRRAYIFLSDCSKDMLQLPKIVDLMKVFGNGEINPIILNHVKKINDILEKEKINSLFCDKIQQFGYCPNQSLCKYRHILLKAVDAPADNIPMSGLAIIKILNVYDANHMSVKLLKLNPTNNLNDVQDWLDVQDNSAIIRHELNSFYSNPDYKIVFENPKPGDIVAVELDVKFREIYNAEYFRATVIDLVKLSPMNPQVRVKLIDEGFVEIVSKWKIFVLPDKFKSMQTTTVDMYVLSVKPIDSDKVWCDKADTMIKKKFKLVDICSDTIIVKVKLALRTTIWVSKIHRKYWNPELRKYDFEAILPDLLFNFSYADSNAEHLDKLTELSTSVDIYQPLKENIRKDQKLSQEEFMSQHKLPQPQWAYLDQHADDVISVDFIISPKCFFVRNIKYHDCLVDLNMKIDNYIEQNQAEELKHIIEGMCCLAKYPPNNRYRRAQIFKIFNETFVEVLFVDIGDFLKVTSNSLLTIPSNLINLLPFQIIECSLHGVNEALPSDNENNELVDFMFDLTSNPLYSKVIDTTSSLKLFGGNCHDVILYDEKININLDMHAKYNQYFDYNKILNQLNNQYVNDNQMYKADECANSKELIDQKPLFDENLFEDDNMGPDDLIAQQQLLDQFGLAQFGQDYEHLKEIAEPNNVCVKDSSKDDLMKETITDITPYTKKDLPTIEPIEKIIPVDPTVPKIIIAKKKTKSKLYEKRRDLCLKCNIKYESSIVPICTWYQNKNYIFMKFNILEVDDFSLNYNSDNITFKAQFKDTLYNFCAKTFGFIIDKNITHKRNYEGFHIKAEKLVKTDYKWPRLLACNKRHTYIKYELEHVETKDLTSWINEMKRFKMMALQTPLIENDINISESSDYDSEDDCSNNWF